jgi:membrane protein DedA with SNARE-associated domain
MSDLPGRIQEFLNTAPTAALFLAAFLSGFIETIFPPFPSEGILLVTAFSGARRHIPPWELVVISATGSFLSLYALYLLGRGRLREVTRRRLKRWIGRTEETVRSFFHRWGYGAVLVSRFLPAVRGPLTFLAGVYRLKRLPTAAALLAGCLIWNTLVIVLGYRAGSSWDGSTGGMLGSALLLAGSAILLWALGAGVYRLLRSKSS